MKNKLIISFFLLLSLFKSKGQVYVGMQGGISYNHLHTDISNRASTVLRTGYGVSFALPVEFFLSPWLSVKATPGLIQKSYRMGRTDSLSGIYYMYKNNYIQIPVLARLHYGKKLQVSGGVGGYTGYWMSGKISGRIPDIYSAVSSGSSHSFDLVAFNSAYNFNNTRDNRFEFGWTADIALDYPVKERYLLSFHLIRYYALTDQQKNYQLGHIPQYNQTIGLFLGISYKL